MEFNFRKLLLILAILFGIGYFIRTHYSLQDLLGYVKKNPDVALGPAIDYYAGMTYYSRGRYPESAGAFEQLLTAYPTCQYAADGLLRLGDSYQEMNSWAGARDAYAKYLEQFPDGPDKNLVQSKYDYVKFRGL